MRVREVAAALHRPVEVVREEARRAGMGLRDADDDLTDIEVAALRARLTVHASPSAVLPSLLAAQASRPPVRDPRGPVWGPVLVLAVIGLLGIGVWAALDSRRDGDGSGTVPLAGRSAPVDDGVAGDPPVSDPLEQPDHVVTSDGIRIDLLEATDPEERATDVARYCLNVWEAVAFERRVISMVTSGTGESWPEIRQAILDGRIGWFERQAELAEVAPPRIATDLQQQASGIQFAAVTPEMTLTEWNAMTLDLDQAAALATAERINQVTRKNCRAVG